MIQVVLLKKILAIWIILFFFGLAVSPSLSVIINNISDSKEQMEISVNICGFDRIDTHRVTLSIEDAEKIISTNKPSLSILTHFGMNVIRSKPWEIAESISKKLNAKVIAARDGMEIDLDNYQI